ncbi:MAG: peptide chain release factor N(5)-glutamine methyltransferase [Oscillospiraceae bacterium]|jgi:release factor glutamine methyltransferase|nr:peptide chain release factor N(5)-glutamine methyltransferase [Oscillospiraceae bacterium]
MSVLQEILQNGDIENFKQEAKWILQSAENENQALSFAKKRAEHYPLQYILGEWDFYDLTLKIGEGVLIPRTDTEILVDKVKDFSAPLSHPVIIDLCSGSGAIAFALENQLPNAEIFALEYSEKAFSFLEINKKNLNSRVELIQADVLNYNTNKKFDIITCNPPYLTEKDIENCQYELKFEPVLALNGEQNADGLRYYREISALWRKNLNKNGRLFFEIGATQDSDVKEILSQNDYKNIEIFKDYSGFNRVVTAVI